MTEEVNSYLRELKKLNSWKDFNIKPADFALLIENSIEISAHKDAEKLKEAQAQIEHLEFCIKETTRDLTESIDQFENTSKGLYTLLSTIPNLVSYKNVDLQYIMVNHAFEAWINQTASDIQGRTEDEIYPEYLLRDLKKEEEEVLNTGVSILNLEEKIKVEDSDIWFLTSISPYKDVNGEIVGVITNSLDISHRKKHEIELEIANKKAYDALDIKNEFLANVSHELRTPLHAIMGSLDILLQEGMSEEKNNLLQIINGSSKSLLRQLDEILFYSKNVADETQLNLKEFNLSDSVKTLLNKHRSTIESNGIELRSFNDNRIPKLIIGDELKIMKLIETLLSNSIKFTEKGFIHVILKETRRDQDKIGVRLDIIDTGIGIKKNKQNEIYNIFSAGDTSIKKNHAGAGIGLSVAKKILKILKGQHGFSSQEDVGSHFWFELDLTLLTATSIMPTLSAREIPVLLVEDNIVNQKIAFFSLKKMGFPVDIAENGQEAIEKFSQKDYRLVLMDIQMPVMDGFEATERIRNYEKENGTEKDSVIIALSANVLSRDIQHCFEVGMNEFISKPFSSEKLMEKINFYFNFKK